MVREQELLDQLCLHYGLIPDYEDIWGERHVLSVPTKRALLAAMGVPTADAAQLQQALDDIAARVWQRPLPPVQVCRLPSAPRINITLPTGLTQPLHWRLHSEDGTVQEGQFHPTQRERLASQRLGNTDYIRYGFTLPCAPPPGYYRFELVDTAAMSLIIAPAQCYQPAALHDHGRVWGWMLQLYAVRSRRNWGIGDFGDLKHLLEQAAALGADIIGLNPLHALFPHDPERASPYTPSSRSLLNVLYLDVEAIADYADCDPAREQVAEAQFQAQLRALRASDTVDYAGVAALKLPILERLYQHFRAQHLSANTPRAHAFRQFQQAQGETLARQALFEALQAHFHQQDPAIWGWPVWPAAYQHPDSPAVQAFAEAERERLEFYAYLQWQAALQLEAAGRRSLELGLGVGLYQDLAVGVDKGGSEAWGHRSLYALSASVGAPPDDFSPKGQNWGLPPFIPERLRETAYQPFIDLLRANMRYAGAIRIDHVLGLMRLYCIPNGSDEGGYIAYPLDDLLGILALESQRNRCLVIGEDLGTVPNELRERLAGQGLLSYRLFYFERDHASHFQSPAHYPVQALVAVTTHDLPTLQGYWQGRDLALREQLDLFPSPALRDRQIIARAEDRARLLMALEREHLLPPDVSVQSAALPTLTPALVSAVHDYLARSPAQVMMVQPEDVFGQLEQVNLPGTTHQYPNWRRKLTLDLEDWRSDERLLALCEQLRQSRPPRHATALHPAPQPLPAYGQIPHATYRLQFHHAYTFTDATRCAPYFQALGISHCYASPYLKARPGSLHGYDIIDHHALNPEIGSREDFERYSATLSAHRLGQILDIVPNHMGVMGSDNHWWLDVLENGQAAVHASFFDIHWQAVPGDGPGKLLLPILGAQYGVVLENGELVLTFDEMAGSFSVTYYEHRFPIDPAAYPLLLGHDLARLEQRLGADHGDMLALQSLITAFRHLPGHWETDPPRQAERARDKDIHKEHLAELCRRSADIAWFVQENIKFFNGLPGDPPSFDVLDALLQAQPYRLAYWRVAADDINYRRFFDVNSLAGLATENAAVFAETHQLILDWVTTGKLAGLRIDHPDGLHNPRQYFERLQACFASAGHADEDKPLYLVVEKILESHERLPDDWPVHGTTGYEFANLTTGLLVDAAAEARMTRIYHGFIGEPIDFDELLYDCKKLIIRVTLASELNVLAQRLSRIAQADRRTRDFTLRGVQNALGEVVACFPVYRTYITPTQVSPEDRRHIDWAVAVAKKRSTMADTSIFDFIRAALLITVAEGRSEEFRRQVLEFAMKFQQYTGPVMAKGLEDTAFYRYHRLVALNEVGGDPRRFSVSVAAFHHANQERARRWPHTLLATSTHDSKRAEDVRARITVLTELHEDWQHHLRRWSRLNARQKQRVDNQPAPSRTDEYLLYQTLIGVWPWEELTPDGLTELSGRIEAYMEKALREAKLYSSWINPNSDYEEATRRFVRALLADPAKNRFLADFLPLQRRVAFFGAFNSLAQCLWKLTAPGVPDLYQGTELWDLSLVDPDNRRPVDYARRAVLLSEVQGLERAQPAQVRELLTILADGRCKLYLIWRTLALRNAHPALFREGGYLPLTAQGAQAEHVCAYARTSPDTEAVIVTPRLYARLLQGQETLPLGEAVWTDTRVLLPSAASYINIFTNETLTPQVEDAENGAASLPLATLCAHFPLALLVRTGKD